jgi:hypothetical protein
MWCSLCTKFELERFLQKVVCGLSPVFETKFTGAECEEEEL